MMKKLCYIIGAAVMLTLSQSLVSCDDGHVDDPVWYDTSESYTIQISGTFQSLSTWTGSHSVVAACFGDESEYSLIQKVLPSSATDSTMEVLMLSGVPTHSKTVEIALVNALRKRVATLFSYDIPENQRYSDTIKIDVGTLNVGMFGTINQVIFQGTGTNCARCHSSERATAHLDLTTENAYRNLVGVQAYTDESQTRVVPGNAENSFLYKVITEGDEHIAYSHPGLFADEKYTPFLDIIKAWIDGGAKE